MNRKNSSPSLLHIEPFELLLRKARHQTSACAAALCLVGSALATPTAWANEFAAVDDAVMESSQLAVLETAVQPEPAVQPESTKQPEPIESTEPTELAKQRAQADQSDPAASSTEAKNPTDISITPAHEAAASAESALGIDLSMVQDLAVIIEEARKQAQVEYLAEKLRKSPQTVQRYVQLAWDEAQRRVGLRPELLIAIMHKESTFQPKVQSSYGAQGLMQVVRRWHRDKLHASESLFDPVVNVRVGSDILEEYLEMAEGDLSKALAKYSGNARGYANTVISESRKLARVADMAAAEVAVTPELFLQASADQAG
ncbi:MAG TPA: transglycosylase SLT domain-containing protein [Pusillimonas sp.]|uniref:transglycosylase SLT domain-containing protein n=1 Tax=Pusillimonas sp. TaxID=3040095 RepID=UPI002B6FEF8E|nr:transglycosylase SLT domain-containing protein [Pusillimonas sp.]HUH86863.1 transglycosylase SLT domain-containing protein [Pusillimonas sp.]